MSTPSVFPIGPEEIEHLLRVLPAAPGPALVRVVVALAPCVPSGQALGAGLAAKAGPFDTGISLLAEELFRYGHPETVEALCAHGEWTVRARGVRLLASVGDLRHVPVAQRLTTDPEAPVRTAAAHAVEALASRSAPAAPPAPIVLTPEERVLVLVLTGALVPHTAWPHVASLLGSKEDGVRALTADYLARRVPASAEDVLALVQNLDPPGPEAVRVLGRMWLPEAIGVLREIVRREQDRQPGVLDALAISPNPLAGDLLLEWAEDDDAAWAGEAAKRLVRRPEAVARVGEAFRERACFRARYAHLLKPVYGSAAIPLLVDGLFDAEAAVRTGAVQALASFGAEAASSLLPLTDVALPEARLAVFRALVGTRDPRGMRPLLDRLAIADGPERLDLLPLAVRVPGDEAVHVVQHVMRGQDTAAKHAVLAGVRHDDWSDRRPGEWQRLVTSALRDTDPGVRDAGGRLLEAFIGDTFNWEPEVEVFRQACQDSPEALSVLGNVSAWLRRRIDGY